MTPPPDPARLEAIRAKLATVRSYNEIAHDAMDDVPYLLTQLDAQVQRNTALEVEVTRLRTALSRYGGHDLECLDDPCTCGLTAL